MISLYIGFFGLLGVCGLLWYICYDVVSQLITAVQAFQPGVLEIATLTFIEALWYWFPLVLVVAGVVFLVVNSQRGGRRTGY